MTINTLLKHTLTRLNGQTPSPEADALLLLCYTLNVSKTVIYTHSDKKITAEQTEELNKRVNRRIKGEPIAYITGRKPFWKHDFSVTPDTLIPRPDTELLIELALTQLPLNQPLKIADLGTGCGAIAISLALECPKWTLYATDLSETALRVAKNNAKSLHCDNINFYQGSWFEALPKNTAYDAIISNPPYIAENDPEVEPFVRAFEPAQALFSGETGLDAITHLIGQAPRYLTPNGWLLLEHGATQSNAVMELFKKNNYTANRIEKDLAGKPRATLGQLLRQGLRENRVEL